MKPEAAGKKRPAPRSERVAARVVEFASSVPAAKEGVTRLNPGRFMVEHMHSEAKKRADVGVKVRG